MSRRVRILAALAVLLLVLAAIVVAIQRADLPSVLASRLSAATSREVAIGAVMLRPPCAALRVRLRSGRRRLSPAASAPNTTAVT